MPWFVIFAVLLWVAVPLLVVTAAGFVALAPATRAHALAVARGMVVAFALTVVPSVGDDYF